MFHAIMLILAADRARSGRFDSSEEEGRHLLLPPPGAQEQKGWTFLINGTHNYKLSVRSAVICSTLTEDIEVFSALYLLLRTTVNFYLI